MVIKNKIDPKERYEYFFNTYCKNIIMDEKQTAAIKRCLRRRITDDEMSLIIKTKVIENGENVLVYNPDQIEALQKAVLANLSKNQIELLANPDYPSFKMEAIMSALLYRFDEQKVNLLKIMSDPKISLSNMKTIALGFYAGITIEQMDYYLKNPNAKRILGEIFEDIEKYHFTEKDIQPYIERKTTKDQRQTYRSFVKTGCSHPERYFDAEQHFKQFNITDKQKEILIKYAVNGVDIKKLDVFVGKNFTEEQIDFIISAANKEVKSNTKKEKAWEPLK